MEAIPTDAFYDLATLRSVAVHPDGTRIAFVATEYDPDEDEARQSVFVVPADGHSDPYRLTRVSDATTVAWSPDGSRLGVVMAREPDTELRVGRDETETGDEGSEADGADSDTEDASDRNGDDEPKPQVWVYHLERGGDARQVTDRDEGVQDFDWGPDGDRLVVAARDPTTEEQEYLDERREGGPIETERLQHKFDGTGWLDTVTTYLFVVDVDSRDERRLDEAHGGGVGESLGGLQPAWHPADDRIAFRAYHGDDADDTYVQDVYVVDVDSGTLQQITDGEYTAGNPVWSPNGNQLAFTARDPENWYVPTAVCVASMTDGDYRILTDDLDRTLSWHGSPEFVDDETLLGVIADEGWSRFARFDVSADDRADAHERVGEFQRRSETHHQFDVAGGTIATVRSHPNEGADVYAMDAADLDADDDPRRRLTACNDELLDEYPWPATTRERFESDGVEIEAIVYHPPTFDPDEDDPRPTLLWIHGGPMSYDEPRFDFDAAFWSSRGYVVCKVNYRGSTAYGRAFSESLKGAWNTIEVDDLLAGTTAMVQRGYADPDRLFVGGFSQGGVNTAYVLTRTDRFRAGIAEHGVYDMRSAFGTDDSHKWWENDFGLPWESPEAYDDASSITDVDAIETPLLVTAGGEDWRCPPTQAEQLHVSLRKQGVESKLVVYPDEHHNIGDPDRATHRLETHDAWLARFDPERDDPDGEDEPGEDATG